VRPDCGDEDWAYFFQRWWDRLIKKELEYMAGKSVRYKPEVLNRKLERYQRQQTPN
jgi:hypothetical protein